MLFPVEEYPRGYPRLAALQSSDPVFSIFRKFATLHTRCLLLAQDELGCLENRLQAIDAAESTQLYLSSREHDANTDRHRVLADIKLKLREYDDDLMRFFKLCAMSAPTDESVSSFTKWMDAIKPLIEDESRFVKCTNDFVTVTREVEDGFLEEAVERFVRKSGIGQNLLKTKKEQWKSTDPDLHFYSTERRGLLVRFLHTGLASLLLLTPTSLLYLVRDKTARLLIICFFTLTCAFTLAILTRAKRHEIFSSTAAFAAVLVVFVTNIPPA